LNLTRQRCQLGCASRLLHLTLIDILTTAVALRLPGSLRPMLQEIKKNLRAKRDAQPG
jgi:RpiR family transcriptional regulator, carbohydrate utilization regulator